MKWVRFCWIGPPSAKPNWLRWKSGLTFSKWFFAFSVLSRKYSKASPWNSLVPDLETTVIMPPVERPNSAFDCIVLTLNSRIASCGKSCRGSPCCAQLLETPSERKPLL